MPARLLPLAPALALALLWGVGGPWLSQLESASLRPWLVAAGVVAGLGLGWGAEGGTRGALKMASRIAFGGALVAFFGAASLAHRLGAGPAVALGVCGVGSAVTAAVFSGLLAAGLPGDEKSSATLAAIVAAASGALVVAGWTLASGHVLGQRHADGARHAASQARDLCSIVAARALVSKQIDALAGELAPEGGYLVSVDEERKVTAGAGAGVPTGSVVEISEGEPYLCTAAGRTLPCAVRRLADGSDVIAAVPPAPLDGDVVIAFAAVGLLLGLGAVGLARLVVVGSTRDLDRVVAVLDNLGRGPHGMDKPVVAASLDEVGDLAAALGALRNHLRPTLADYEVALEKAQAADQARTQFLQLVSSELRSPLDAIVAGAQALLDPASEKLTPEQAEDVRIVSSSSLHLVDLIDEVLDISAIATGQVVLKFADVDVGRVVGEVAKAQRPIVQKKGVEVRIHIDEPSPHAKIDERRLRQVVTNLVGNAAKFTEKGFVEVSAHARGGEIEISVRDTGPGIAPEQLPRLFTEFVQLGSLKQRAHGTGLGLAICKRLVEAHGGRVSADSVPGQGSTFRVVVPVAGPPGAS
jgi:signal transduction histidine kinase